ncbi:MAG: hypothetical protein JO126_04580 [Alphaproteobacteria bacterium]|nr:hypothetical protein [Alphaproteobacteria bacterium]
MAYKTLHAKRKSPLAALQDARMATQLIRDRAALAEQITGLRQHLAAHAPRGSTRYIKTARSNPSLFVKAGEGAVGRFIGRGLLGEAGLTSGGFYASTSMIAQNFSALLGLAARDN